MAEKVVVDLEVRNKKGVKEVEELNKSLTKTNESQKKIKKSTQDSSNTLDKFTGGAVTKLRGFKGSIGGVVKGFKNLKFAIIASGIGALLIAVVAVGKAFTSSEEGQNKFAKIMGVIGSVTGNLIDLLAKLGEKIIYVFENPKQAIKDFAKLIKENITNRFEGLLELIPNLGKAVSELFKGNFSKAGKIAADAVGKVALRC